MSRCDGCAGEDAATASNSAGGATGRTNLVPLAVSIDGRVSARKGGARRSNTAVSRDRRNRVQESSDGGGAGSSKGAKGINAITVNRD
jgi:hypothetical protein